MRVFCIVLVLFTTCYSFAQPSKVLKRKYKHLPQPVYIQKHQLKSGSEYLKLDSAINYVLNDMGALVPNVKEAFEYDEKGNLIQNTDYYWDKARKSWKRDYKWELEYNEFLQWTSVLITTWSKTDSQWVNIYKEDYDYNSANLKTQIDYYKPDSTATDWINDYKEEFLYDSDNYLIEHLYLLWDSDSGQWKNDYKIKHVYDTHGNRIKSDFFKPGIQADSWINDYKSIYTFNDSSLLVQTLHANWDLTTNAYSIDFRGIHSYDTLGNRIQNVYYEWLEPGFWQEQSKVEFVYDENSLLTNYLLFSWDTLTAQWVNTRKKDFSYPYSVDQNNLIIPDYFYTDGSKTDINALASNITSIRDSANENWIISEKRTLFFSEFNVIKNPIAEEKVPQLSIYPNPVSDILHIDVPAKIENLTFELFNANGTRVYMNTNITEIPVSAYPNGLYFLKISSDGKPIQTGKIIIH